MLRLILHTLASVIVRLLDVIEEQSYDKAKFLRHKKERREEDLPE